MATSTDGILEAVFDPAWAAVRLIVDGGMWPAGARINETINPAMATDVTGWTGSSAAVILTHDATSGGRGKLTVGAAGAPIGTRILHETTAKAYTVGQLRSGRMSVTNARATAASFRLRVQPYDSGGGSLAGAIYGPTVSIPGNTTVDLVVDGASLTAVGTVLYRLSLYVETALVNGDIVYVDNALTETATTVGTYFDGGTAATVTTVHAWTGAANASTSTATLRAVDTITITRSVAGEPSVPVRGVESRRVVGGTFVGTDHEIPLSTDVTYLVEGRLSTSSVPGVLASATVTVSTSGAAAGAWVKVAGKPDLTIRSGIRGISVVSSRTIGAAYQIAGGGGTVPQTTAQWSGIEPDAATITLSVAAGVGVARLRAVLAAARVVLLQPVGSTDLDPGWYFVTDARRVNPSGVEAFGQRWFELDVQRTGIPAGQGSGIAGNSWAILMDTYPTWADVLTRFDSWFDALKGA